jgi:hypothetical protein
MENNQQLSNEKSLEIIHQMINQAKTNITDNGLSWLLWGSMLFLTSLSTFCFITIGAKNIFLGWNIFGLVTIVLLAYGIFKPRKKAVKTYIGDLMKLVDIGFVVSLFTVIFAMNIAVNPNSGFGFLLMVFSFFMLVKGGAANSKVLMCGAAVNWAGAIAMFVNKDFRYDMLIMAIAIFTGYIIPGIIMWRQYKTQLQQQSSNTLC